MSAIMEEMGQRALKLGIPLSVQLDLTYRCNERCVHCYLDHEDHGEMNTQEILTLLDDMAAAGVFFLTLSGGEILMRKDFFEILEHARALMFSVKLKTNAILIREKEAERIRALGVESIQISIYSHRPEIHDAITKIPGSLERSLHAIRFLKTFVLKVIIANVLMIQNIHDQAGVRALGAELDCYVTIDPTITPMMDGDRGVLDLNISHSQLENLFHNPELVGNVDEFCAIPAAPDADMLDSLPCSAGHTAAYVSPYRGWRQPWAPAPPPCCNRPKRFRGRN